MTTQPAPAPQKLPQATRADAWIRHKFGAKHLDQAAGFMAWCKRRGLLQRPRPTPEWVALYDEFTNTPVGG